MRGIGRALHVRRAHGGPEVGRLGRLVPRHVVGVHSLGGVVGAERDEVRDEPGVAHREVEADDPAVAPAHDVAARHVEPRQQRGHVLGHGVVGERPRAIARAALRASVGDEEPVARFEERHLPGELIAVADAAVEQDDDMPVDRKRRSRGRVRAVGRRDQREPERDREHAEPAPRGDHRTQCRTPCSSR